MKLFKKVIAAVAFVGAVWGGNANALNVFNASFPDLNVLGVAYSYDGTTFSMTTTASSATGTAGDFDAVADADGPDMFQLVMSLSVDISSAAGVDSVGSFSVTANSGAWGDGLQISGDITDFLLVNGAGGNQTMYFESTSAPQGGDNLASYYTNGVGIIVSGFNGFDFINTFTNATGVTMDITTPDFVTNVPTPGALVLMLPMVLLLRRQMLKKN